MIGPVLTAIYLAVCLGETQSTSRDDPRYAAYGHVPIAAATGNGRLTAGVDPHGRVVALRWPAPSANDHLYFRQDPRDTANEIGHAIAWGMESEDGVVWQNDSRWDTQVEVGDVPGNVLHSRSTLSSSGAEVNQRAYVHPGRDLLTIELTAPNGATLHWAAEFAPCTRDSPAWPAHDWALDDNNGFAAFIDSEGFVIQFRPSDPGKEEWRKAGETIGSSGNAAEWSAFGDGVWIACIARDAKVELLDADARAVNASLGRSRIQLKKSETLVVHIAIAGTYETAKATAQWAANQDQAEIRAASANAYAQWLQNAVVPVGDTLALSEGAIRCLVTMHTLESPDTGAIVQSPSLQPPLARDLPRRGIWSVFAYALGGYGGAARAHLENYADALHDGDSGPRGAMPPALDAAGRLATRRGLADVVATARFAYVTREVVARSPESDRDALFERVEPAVGRAADFLASWAQEGRGEPWHGYDPTLMRDVRQRGDWLELYRGLDAVIDLYTAFGREADIRPIWRSRLREAEVGLLNLTAGGPVVWDLNESLPYGVGNVFPNGMSGIEASIALRAMALADESLAPGEAARALRELAFLAPDYPEARDIVKQYATAVLGRGVVDAYAAADAYVAVVLAYSAD